MSGDGPASPESARSASPVTFEEADLSKASGSQIYEAIVNSTIVAVDNEILVTFPSELTIVRDELMKVDFAVRVATNLSRKPTLTSKPSGFAGVITDKEKDPFMPPFEIGLSVGRLDESHRLLLNKYNVVNYHTLITTTEMEHQFTPIRTEAFSAIHRVLKALDGLVFFNRGVSSGASQPHKHYQLIPRRISEEVPDLPMASAILQYAHSKGFKDSEAFSVEHFPFKHACCISKSGFSAEQLESSYHGLLSFLNISEDDKNVDSDISYNWLSTSNWMFLVPRVKENYEESIERALHDLKVNDFSQSFEMMRRATKIPINSLGFAGTLFVKTANALKHVQEKSPSEILSQVAAPKFDRIPSLG